MWSAGNEVAEQATERGQEVLGKLVEIFHKEDPTRPVTVGNDKIVADDGPARLPFLEMQDIVGYNYADRWHERRELIYSIDRHDHPDWKIIGTEDISVRGVRGEYYLEYDKLPSWPGFSRDYRTSMIRAERLWKFTAVHDYVIGNFMWTGIDYLGEAWWPSKNSSSGVIDLCGFPKDGYYFYQSQWTSKPMIHMFPHWNWEGYEGHIIPVIVCTNCDSVELFLNSKSFGTKSYVFPQQGNSGSWITYGKPFIIATTSEPHLSWDVPYEPGILKVTGKKGGKVVCAKEIHTTSGPAAIRLSADRNIITADAQDIVHVKVEIIDENGLVVPTANNIVEFMVEGEGVLAGTDNGNPKDITPMKSKHRSAFNGLALAVIRSTERSGDIRITAVSENLKGDALQIASQKPDNALITVESLK